jgi:hypothetical protein
MSMNSFQLKGNGWYVTDYAGKKSDGASSSPAKETSDKSADTKATPAKTAPEAPKTA